MNHPFAAEGETMRPMTIHEDPPRFELDPVSWFAWVRRRLRDGGADEVMACKPVAYIGRDGHRWRVIRTDGGIEVRPELGTTFFRETRNPQVHAVQIHSDAVTIELASAEGRWSGRFSLDELDLSELGRAMIEERHLPHDNLRFLFAADER